MGWRVKRAVERVVEQPVERARQVELALGMIEKEKGRERGGRGCISRVRTGSFGLEEGICLGG